MRRHFGGVLRMKSRVMVLQALSALTISLAGLSGSAIAQTPRANGETLKLQVYAGTLGNMHATIAKTKGFCEKYNFHCELVTINSTPLGLQALVGKSIDVSLGGADLVAASIVAGADVAIIATT